MPLNKQKGNMYPWVDYTLTIYRRCKHDCIYCYRKAIPNYEKLPAIAEEDFKLNLNNKGIIFTANTGDLFGHWVPEIQVYRILDFLKKFTGNVYLLQTKNPGRFINFCYPKNSILGTTIETNRSTKDISKAPIPFYRYLAMKHLQDHWFFKRNNCKKMISIEPIMDFDLKIFIHWFREIKPNFVSIGADSKNHNLQEPPAWKVKKLIEELKKFTEVKIKDNLKRILK